MNERNSKDNKKWLDVFLVVNRKGIEYINKEYVFFNKEFVKATRLLLGFTRFFHTFFVTFFMFGEGLNSSTL